MANKLTLNKNRVHDNRQDKTRQDNNLINTLRKVQDKFTVHLAYKQE